MTTVDELRITLEKDYLEPVNERTAQSPLVAQIDTSVLALTITSGVLSPDEESLFGPGAVLELDYEVVDVAALAAKQDVKAQDRHNTDKPHCESSQSSRPLNLTSANEMLVLPLRSASGATQ